MGDVLIYNNNRMINWLKKHFIPHAENDHRPHFLRGDNIRSLLVMILMLELGVYFLPFSPTLNLGSNSYTATVLPAVLDDLTNENRQSQNLPTLTVNPLLNEVAQLKANDMAQKGYFAHVSPEGKAPWYWFKQVGYDYEYAGENLAVDFTDSQDVDQAWMNSPTHKANILKGAYTEMGTGIATGTYQGSVTVFVAQEFGKPAVRKEVAISPVEVVSDSASTTTIAKSSTTLATSSKVLGASAEIVSSSSTESELVATTTVETATPVVVQTKNTHVSFFAKYATSPRHIVNIVLGIIGLLVVIAITLKLVIKRDQKHPTLITNGLIVLVIILGVYVVSNYMVRVKLDKTSSFSSFTGESFN